MAMKELTIEEKAKRYDEALANAKYYHSEMEGDVCCVLEECFSELKESNDENIKSCIGVILTDANETRFNDFHTTLADCLAWLEKQDEPKLASKMQVSEKLYEHIRNTCACIDDALSSETLADITDYLEMADKDAKSAFDMIEKQDEQKPSEWSEEDKGILLSIKCVIDNVWHSTSDIDTGGYSKEELKEMWEWLDKIWQIVEYHEEKQDEQNHAYKIEPKFKVGDTIVEIDIDECGYGTIKDIKDGQYIFTNGSSLNINEQEGWRLVKTSTNHE